jgi:two-component system NtrC family sensor kinase
MSLRLKLVVIIAFVATVPLIISAYMLLDLHLQASTVSTQELHHEKAAHGASVARTYFETLERSVTSAVQSIRWSELSQKERDGALWLVYRQIDDVMAVTLVDHQGESLSPAVYADGRTAGEALGRHPGATMAVLQEFARHIPLADAQSEGQATGAVFATGGAEYPFMSTVLRVNGDADASWAIAICVSLRTLCTNLNSSTDGNIEVYLVDPMGRAVCRRTRSAALEPADPKLLRLAKKESTGLFEYHPVSGAEFIAAVVPASRGWRVVAEQPVYAAFATGRKMRIQTILFITLGIIAALIIGWFLAQSITRPVRRLVEGALQLANGNFGYRLSMTGNDELGQLSETFNHMSTEIEKRDGEIRAWNEDLQQRVDERTRELKEAQEQLLQSQKISAVTALGAGIAHEINNPLTGVIGLTQVLMTEMEGTPDNEEKLAVLKTVEKEALRVKGIVRNLLTFTQDYVGEGFSLLDINDVLAESIEFIDTEADHEPIEIVREFAHDAPKILGNKTQLQQAFLHLINNSRIAMPNGGKLMLSTTSVEGRLVKIAVTDTGKGIAPENLEKIFEPFFTTKDDWQGEGLGLTVVFRIVEQHNGTIKVSSKVGEGTTITITMPLVKRGAHLA